MKKNRRSNPATPPPLSVEVPPISIETWSLRFHDGSRWIFNITRARQIVRIDAMREIHQLDHGQLGQLIADLVRGKGFDRQTIDQADPRIPGIGAVIDYGGQRRLNLIDGLERAVNAYVAKQGFPLYVLSDDERDRCIWSRTGLQGIADKIQRGEMP